MAEKNKSGAGKFVLGALLGGIAGAIAGKFVSDKTEKCEKGECKCGDECDCKEEDKPHCEKTKEEKEAKPAEKSNSEKK